MGFSSFYREQLNGFYGIYREQFPGCMCLPRAIFWARTRGRAGHGSARYMEQSSSRGLLHSAPREQSKYGKK